MLPHWKTSLVLSVKSHAYTFTTFYTNNLYSHNFSSVQSIFSVLLFFLCVCVSVTTILPLILKYYLKSQICIEVLTTTTFLCNKRKLNLQILYSVTWTTK